MIKGALVALQNFRIFVSRPQNRQSISTSLLFAFLTRVNIQVGALDLLDMYEILRMFSMQTCIICRGY